MVLALFKTAIGGFAKPEVDRRRLPRLTEEDASVVLKNMTYPLLDWHPGGFRIGRYSGSLTAGDRTQARLILRYREISYGFDVFCEVRHIEDRRKTLGAHITDLDPATSQRLKRVFASRL